MNTLAAGHKRFASVNLPLDETNRPSKHRAAQCTAKGAWSPTSTIRFSIVGTLVDVASFLFNLVCRTPFFLSVYSCWVKHARYCLDLRLYSLSHTPQRGGTLAPFLPYGRRGRGDTLVAGCIIFPPVIASSFRAPGATITTLAESSAISCSLIEFPAPSSLVLKLLSSRKGSYDAATASRDAIMGSAIDDDIRGISEGWRILKESRTQCCSGCCTSDRRPSEESKSKKGGCGRTTLVLWSTSSSHGVYNRCILFSVCRMRPCTTPAALLSNSVSNGRFYILPSVSSMSLRPPSHTHCPKSNTRKESEA